MPVAAYCPHPPLLVEGITGGPVAEVEALRRACRAAVATLLASSPRSITLVGVDETVPAGETSRSWSSDACGTLAGLGVDVLVPRGARDGARDRADVSLPLSLTVGRWLLDDAGFTGTVSLIGVAEDADPVACRVLGEALRPNTLLVLADGSNRRGPKPPGGVHSDAGAHDAVVGRALAHADPAALEELDLEQAEQVGASGRPGWQVLAGWARGRRVTSSGLLLDDAPFGVGYLVGTWSTT